MSTNPEEKRDASPKRKGKFVHIVLKDNYVVEGNLNIEDSFDEEVDPATEVMGVFGSKPKATAYCKSIYKSKVNRDRPRFTRKKPNKTQEWIWKYNAFDGSSRKVVLRILKESVQ